MKRVIQALVPLLILVIGLSVFFQGLPWQFRVKEEYGSLRHNTLTVMDTMKEEDIPEGWKEYSAGGIAFFAPSGLKFDENAHDSEYGITYTDGITTVTVYSGDDTSNKISVDEHLSDIGLTAADLRWFCKRTSKPYPRDEFEFGELCFGLSPTDLDIHSYKQSRIFHALLEMCPNIIRQPNGSVQVDIIKDEETRMYAVSWRLENEHPYITATVYPNKSDKMMVYISSDLPGADMEIATSLHSAAGTEET